MHQRAASRALFSPYPGNSEPQSLLSDSLDGADRKQLLQIIQSFLQNDDSVVRASVIPVLEKLNDQELAQILPDLIRAIEILAPTNEMWGDDIRLAGLDILSRRYIREGMDLCVSTIEWRWGNDYQRRLEFLQRYGKNAQAVVTDLRKKLPRDYPEGTAHFEKAIAEIADLSDAPQLVRLKDFIANASNNNALKGNRP
jgi:hypothetical protein